MKTKQPGQCERQNKRRSSQALRPSMGELLPAMMVVRRPIQSAKSPAIRAPKKVPAERMDVIKDFFQAGKVKAFFSAVVGFAGR